MYFVRRCTATARRLALGRAARRPSAGRARTSPSSPSTSSARLAHAGHDPHDDRDVGGVGELDADLGDRRAERAHRERHDVHRAAAHRSRGTGRRASRASRPGRASCWSGRRRPRAREQMKVRSSTRATSPGSRAREVGVRAAWRRRAARTSRRRRASWQSASYSSAEPSHQWTSSGWVSSATSSTQASSFSCVWARRWSSGSRGCQGLLTPITRGGDNRIPGGPLHSAPDACRAALRGVGDDGQRSPAHQRRRSDPGLAGTRLGLSRPSGAGPAQGRVLRPAAPRGQAQPLKGDSIAQIDIPSIGVSEYVVEGTDTESLRKGPGHYPETPLPGERGTSAIAGHRTTYGAPFRKIDQLKPASA